MFKILTEYRVNGFQFDLASVLCRGPDGAPLNAPPIVKAIAKDPVLSKCKIIAEPWDCRGLYLVGKFPKWDSGGIGSGFFFKGERMLSKHFMRSMQTSTAGEKNLVMTSEDSPSQSVSGKSNILLADRENTESRMVANLPI